MSGSGGSKERTNGHDFPYYDLEAAIEVLGAFITSGIRDEVEALRQEVAAVRKEIRSGESTKQGRDDHYLNQRQAAKFLGCSTGYIRKQRREGSFPKPIKLSARGLRWSKSALREWANTRQLGRRPNAADP